MKLRLGSAALAVAVAAPLLAAAPASAKKHDDIDADALAALKAAIVASDQQFAEQGGTYRSSYESELLGEKFSLQMTEEVDATGAAHLRFSLMGQSQEFYADSRGRPVAVKLTGQLRRALTKHGLRHAPTWYVPGKIGGAAGTVPPVKLAEGLDSLEKGLVALSAKTSGTHTTYKLTTSTELAPGASLRLESTVETDNGLMVRVSEPMGGTTTISYGHAPITAPEADRTHRKLIEAESLLAEYGILLDAAAPSRYKPRAVRVKALRKAAARFFGEGAGGPKTTLKDVPGGVRVTTTIKSWKHPLAWRYTVTKKGVATRPARTV